MLCARRADGPHREVWADLAEVSRGRSTGRECVWWAGKGRTLCGTRETVLLVPVAVIAAIPRDAGLAWEERVQSR